MEAAAKPTNGVKPVERDPAYSTWEAERTALVLRQHELDDLSASVDPFAAAESAYDAMLKDGFGEAHARQKADSILAEHEAMRAELRRIHVRLSLIKPQVTLERMRLARDVDKNGYQERLFGYLERIVTAIEGIAVRVGCEAPGQHKRGRKKARAKA